MTFLQSMLFDSVQRGLIDTFSPGKKEYKSQLYFSRDGNRIDINPIGSQTNSTESPLSLILEAINMVAKNEQASDGEGRVTITDGGITKAIVTTTERGKIRQILPHVIPSSKALRRDDITLLTHLSPSRLSKLTLQVEWWPGPISAAIVVTNENEANILIDFVKTNQAILRMTSFHVLVEANVDPNSYPYNVLRNVAMREAKTDYVLAVDVDFVAEGYQRLVRLVRENDKVKEALHSMRLLVIPAFENTELGAKRNAIPQSKADIVKMVDGDLVAPFQLKKWPPGHKPTNFTKYYQNDADIFYDIEYRFDFEPYVLAYRHGLPRYWNDFRSYFYNKCSYFIEAHLMGYKFSVLRDFYVFHMGQSGKSTGIDLPPPEEQAKNWKFHEYLSSSYGVPLSGKVVQLIPEREVLK